MRRDLLRKVGNRRKTPGDRLYVRWEVAGSDRLVTRGVIGVTGRQVPAGPIDISEHRSSSGDRCDTLSGVERPSWVPGCVDIDQPSVARVYDYYLGGSHNFEADRLFAAKVIAAVPDMRWVITENRAFLRRAVKFMLES